MSVQSEINRLATAKTAIGTAIAGKGVAVPSGTKLDGMAALIDGIEAGGGSVETCTVAIIHDGKDYGFKIYTATCYENDEIVVKSGTDIVSGNATITNVILGSVVTVEAFSYDTITCEDAELIASPTASLTRAFKITAAADEIAFIRFM